MNYQTIDTSAHEGILTLRLNRPECLNAFTVEMADELVDGFERASADDAFRDKRRPDFRARCSDMPSFYPWWEQDGL